MSIFVLEDVGASTPGTPLRLRFDSVGDTEVDFLVDDQGQLHIRPENGDMFLGVKGTTDGEVEIRTFNTGAFEDDLFIVSADEMVLCLNSNNSGIAVGRNPNSTSLAVDVDSAKNNFVFMRFDHAGSAPLGWILDYSASSIRGNLNDFLIFRDSVGDLLTVDSEGDVENLNNSYAGISDENLKQDIVDADPQSQWDDIKAMRFRKFRFKDTVEAHGEDALTCLGCVAQELQAVSPGLVTTKTRRTVVTETLDEVTGEKRIDNQQFDDGDPVLSTKYSVLYMKGMVALQEAMRRIEVLEAAARA